MTDIEAINIKNNERIKKEIRTLNLTSDFFLSVALEDMEACEYVLKILMDDNSLKVIQTKSQYSIRQIGTHSVVLDILAEDNTGQIYEIEMQTGDKPGHIRRVRYITSSIDTSFLDKGNDYTKLPELHIFYITTFDIANAHKTVYDIIRIDSETHIEFDNGVHEHYINTIVNDGSTISNLMHYFNNTDSSNMNYGALSKRVKYLKESKGGNSYMCEFIEKIQQESHDIGRLEGLREGRREGQLEGGIQTLIIDNLEDGKSKDIIIMKLEKRFGLSPEDAEYNYNKCLNK